MMNILIIIVAITLVICPVSAASVLDDNVPREKAKKPKLAPLS